MNKESNNKISNTDLLVIGSGIAGCTTALEAADLGKKVILLSSALNPLDSNSYLAQGGIIYKAKNEPNESNLLSADIQRAGAGKCDLNAVTKLTQEGPQIVDKLLLGGRKDHESVPFDKTDEGELSLCLEASHSRPRILHWSDATGRVIMENLLVAVHSNENIELRCDSTAIDLLKTESQCNGAFVLTKGCVSLIKASNVVLATGGCGDVYSNTSNPPSARGDGIAMALRAGAQVKNMEFLQFHPTTLYMPGERNFLLTEALRGEGAQLRDPISMDLFAKSYHVDGELAPRDVVTRMIISQMKKTNSKFVYLDITHLGESFVAKRFPAIFNHCLERGLNLGKDLIPVVPAAHYSCGGIEVDLFGQTSLANLYAVGEVSCTGLHGSNRLASTSLLEGMVWGSAAVKSIYNLNKANQEDINKVSENEDNEDVEELLSTVSEVVSDETIKSGGNDYGNDDDTFQNLMTLVELNMCEDVEEETKNVWLNKSWTRLRQIMWNKVGIVRHPSLLKQAVEEIGLLVNQSENAFKISLATSLHKTSTSQVKLKEHVDTIDSSEPMDATSYCLDHSQPWLKLLQSIEGYNLQPYETCPTNYKQSSDSINHVCYERKDCDVDNNSDIHLVKTSLKTSLVDGKWQEVLGLRNACLTAHSIAKSALNNLTSSGAHFVVPDVQLEISNLEEEESKQIEAP